MIEEELLAAKPFFKTFSPSLWMLPIRRYRSLVMTIKTAFVVADAVKMIKSGTPVSTAVGEVVGGRVIRIMRRPVRKQVVRLHKTVTLIPKKDMMRKNGMGSRGWLNTPGQYPMVIVFHDANRVGPHIDVHIGRLSMVYRVKPDLYAQLKYNNQGMLTEASRNLILNHIRSEIAKGARVPQNLDHSVSNGKAQWTGGDPAGKDYGAGRTRQVIAQTTVDVYKTGPGHPIELYAPILNPHRSQYIYKIYSGENKTAPILIWGTKSAAPPKLEDRLHLKMIDPKDMDKLRQKADMSTSTGKYDGSSAYIVITEKGTTAFSPRVSVKTGEQIEYTAKLDGIANTKSPSGTIVAMGEVVFRDKRSLRNFWRATPYYSSATGSGILNGHVVLPNDVQPEVRLYRVDRIGRTSTGDLPFWDNRLLQEEVAKLHPNLKVVELMTPEEAKEKGFEGVVVIPEGKSVNDGFKVKWWSDANDWKIDRVDFEYGEKGGIAGVVRATSLNSGRQFNLGPGQVGNRELTEHMLNNPEDYRGVVLKVQSREGHEGRAAKVVAIHDDKGFAPL